eukprot:5278955-Pleurochrysis_carterae.AAC.1
MSVSIRHAREEQVQSDTKGERRTEGLAMCVAALMDRKAGVRAQHTKQNMLRRSSARAKAIGCKRRVPCQGAACVAALHPVCCRARVAARKTSGERDVSPRASAARVGTIKRVAALVCSVQAKAFPKGAGSTYDSRARAGASTNQEASSKGRARCAAKRRCRTETRCSRRH